MQLALSMAFVSGQISARTMTRFARRIEHDIETIALNRTSVGFAHGADTFGWRFYPRFQTPDNPSNATVLFRDLLIGGPRRDALLRERQLEPGMRECVAIVIMPSFVPCVSIDVSSNWFRLTNPKCKEFDLTETMRISRKVKAIQQCMLQVNDQHCYRDCDAAMLMRRLDQLSARLPLQNQLVQVPYENTLGGFGMFSNGVTDLAPDLIGWYGAPGIDPSRSTSLFLVGDNFSVHQTRVIAGGLVLNSVDPVGAIPDEVRILATPTGPVGSTWSGEPPVALQTLPTNVGKQVELLSRQIVRATIPPGSKVEGGFVSVHVATPYGVTHHLRVPAVLSAKSSESGKAGGYSLSQAKLSMEYRISVMKRIELNKIVSKPIVIDWSSSTGAALSPIEVELAFKTGKGASIPEDKPVKVKAVPGKAGTFVIAGNDLDNLAKQIVLVMNADAEYSSDSPAPNAIDAEVKIGPDGQMGFTVQPVEISDRLSIEFIRVP